MSNSKIYLGTNNLGSGKIKLGANDVSAIYLGANKEYPPSNPIPLTDLLCFTATTAPASFVLSTHNISPTIYYTTDNGNNWTQWDYSAITLQNVGDKVYFYGVNPNGISNANGGYCHFSQSTGNVGAIAASGDIMSLINYTCPTTIPNNGCFYGLFDRFIQLTTAPRIGATTLTESCYAYMFNGCTNLTTAPELPVTTVPAYAYQQMFQGCTSLATAPDLPATNLGNSSYEMMFYGCTSLTTSPVLPAKTIPTYAYNKMFQYCSSLNSVTCLATDISASMCTNIWLSGVAATGTFTKSPNMSSWTTGTSGIPSGWTVQDNVDYLCFTANEANCTVGMTHTGTNQTTTKPLMYYSTDNKQTWTEWDYSTITLANVDDKVYFYGDNPNGFSTSFSNYSKFTTSGSVSCSGNIMTLITRYGDRETIPSDYCFCYLFISTTITTAPAFPATTLASSCYYYMFQNCTSLTTAPSILPATTLASNCYGSMFFGCTSLTTAPELPATTLVNNCYSNMFVNCASLTTAPELPATTLASNCYYCMFQNCTSLTTAPELPAATLVSGCYQSMFSGCSSLTTAPELPATTLADNCYSSMFSSCTSLTTPPALPATTLSGSCYSSMFSGCTSLTTAPELPATTLANDCYRSMFNRCSQLNLIKVGATSWNSNYTRNWVNGVAATGTFIKPTELVIGTGPREIPQNVKNGIPAGWTVEDGTTEPRLYAYTSGTDKHNFVITGEWPNDGVTRTVGDIKVYDNNDTLISNSYIEIKVRNGVLDYDDYNWKREYGQRYILSDTGRQLVIETEMDNTGWYTEFDRYFQNCDDWQSRGYSDYEDCMCNENQMDCPPEP